MFTTKNSLTRVSLFAVATLALLSGLAEAASAATLYIAGYHLPGEVWSNPGIGGGAISPAIVTANGDERIIDVAADSAGGKIYYSYRTVGAAQTIIGKANLNGTGAAPLITGTQPAQGLAVDTVGQKLYWWEANTGTLRSASTSGGAVTPIVSGLTGALEGLDLDVAKNLYYGTRITAFGGGGSSEILVGSLSGGAPSVLFSDGGFIDGVDLDLVNNKIYWSNSATSTIGVANLSISGLTISGATTFASTVGGEDVEVDPIGGHVYWSNFGSATIGRSVNLLTGAGANQSYITGVSNAWGLAIAQDVAPGVPEPSTFVLAALGLAGLGIVAWRRRRRG